MPYKSFKAKFRGVLTNVWEGSFYHSARNLREIKLFLILMEFYQQNLPALKLYSARNQVITVENIQLLL